MFCLDPLHPVYTAIVEIIAEEPGLSMAELHARLQKRKDKEARITLQHTYRVVDALMDGHVAVKTKGKVMLNASWLSYIEVFAGKAQRAMAQSVSGLEVVPLEPNTRVTLHAASAADVQTLWHHLLAELHRLTQERLLFTYSSHAWWQSIQNKYIRCHCLYGNDTFLDRTAAAKHQEWCGSRIAAEPGLPKKGYTVSVYGEYILECQFPEEIARQMAFFFRSVTSAEAFDEKVLQDVCMRKAKYSMTVSRNKKQASAVRASIAKCFV